ncbi:MAG: heat-inducible transcription repressor HrcA [Gammaproteobacteria bacterium]|nr:heat-inducible transcription repressor HrcA [Gammaproteobacteria bacterium]
MSDRPKLDPRAQTLLKSLILSYTKDGLPVGSKKLLETCNLDVSSATIRNIMAKLEDFGLVNSPHTSAGRIPTDAGYRFFIDSLLDVQQAGKTTSDSVEQAFANEHSSGDLIQSASTMLSQMTHLTGLITLTKSHQATIKHIEFIKLSDTRILVVLVLNQDEVHNKIIELNRNFSEAELHESAHIINTIFVGKDFDLARKEVVVQMHHLKGKVNEMMSSLIDVMDGVCSSKADDELLLSGETNLMQFNELSDMNKLKGLFDAFHQKQDLLHLLDSCNSAKGVEIFIGSESGYAVLHDCSVVSAPYSVDGKVLGVLGVIGPTRIAYDKIIPVVDVTAKLLSSALKTQN